MLATTPIRVRGQSSSSSESSDLIKRCRVLWCDGWAEYSGISSP